MKRFSPAVTLCARSLQMWIQGSVPHPSVSVDETINGWYSDLQAGTHTINGYRKAMYTCEVCWNSWDGEELGTELVSRVENHEFVED